MLHLLLITGKKEGIKRKEGMMDKEKRSNNEKRKAVREEDHTELTEAKRTSDDRKFLSASE